MTSLSTPHALQPFWDLAGSQVKMKALEIALSKSLFNLLQDAYSAEKIANAFQFEPNNTEVWLELLWSMGLLEKSQDGTKTLTYKNTKIAQDYFISTSSLDCSQAMSFRFQTLHGFAQQFETCLKNIDQNTSSAQNIAPLWANAAKAQIFQEQRAVTVPALKKILDASSEWALSIPKDMHFLDLGGGAGLVSLALAEYFPKSTGVLFDLFETTEVAQNNINEANAVNQTNIAERIKIQSGDLNNTLPKGAFDVIWCSSVLHFLREPKMLLKHFESILKPNGTLLILHAEHSLNQALSEKVLPFYLPMIMKGKYLPKYNDIPTYLQSNKMTLIKSVDIACFPMAPVTLHCLRKES